MKLMTEPLLTRAQQICVAVILITIIHLQSSFTEAGSQEIRVLSLEAMVFFYIFSAFCALLTAGIILYAPLS